MGKQVDFKGKRILFVHNGGENALYIDTAKQLGMEVDQLPDKPNEKAFGKIAGRLHLKFYERLLEKYYRKALDILDRDYDYIIVIRGEYTPHKAIEYMRKKFPRAKLVLYMWDSLKFNHGIESKWDMFDKVYTFDRKDYQKHINRIGFLPLFYCEDYIQELDKDTEPEYDIAFIGTAHSDRTRIVNIVDNECRTRGLKMFKYLYCPHILVYIYNKLTNKAYRSVHKKDLSFVSKTQKEIYAIYNKAKCILDIEIREQTGLTMRTMDILGLRKKLITTNQDIVNYDFYNPNNILVIDRDNLSIDYGFLDLPYQELSGDIYQKYSIKNWLIQLLV